MQRISVELERKEIKMQGFRPHYYRGNFRGNRGNNRFKNNYEPSTERNENNIKQFWCETCDRDFNSLHLLEQHKQQHQTCNIDGCKFVAHPKVITKHIQMQHSSGLFNKISKLNNPVEIQKWREERRKRYPTKQNIELNIAQAKEKFNRGEKLGLNGKNKKPQHKELKRNNRKRTRHTKTTKLQNDNINVPSNVIERKLLSVTKAIPEVKVRSIKLKPFAGIQELDIESGQEEEVQNNILIEDDEFVAEMVLEAGLETKTAVCGALSNLMNDYGSTDDESEEVVNPADVKPAQNDINIAKISEPTPSDIILKVDNPDSDSGPDEVKIAKDEDFNKTLAPVKPKLKKPHYFRNENRKMPPKRYKPKPPSTLLSKLLAKEIRQERNMVLQCVRHIVKNNYFINK